MVENICSITIFWSLVGIPLAFISDKLLCSLENKYPKTIAIITCLILGPIISYFLWVSELYDKSKSKNHEN